MNDTKNIRNLKSVALKLDDPLKTLILIEPDVLPKERYLELTDEWLKIAKIEKEGKVKT